MRVRRATTSALAVPDERTRLRVAALVVAHGVAPVARLLGVSRTGLTAYLAGVARDGTTLLLQTNYMSIGEPKPA